MAKLHRAGAAALLGAFIWGAAIGNAAAQGSVYQATLGEKSQKTAEISTEEVRRILADGSAILLDSRPRAQYVAGHIAGARNVAPPANAPASDYVAAVENLIQGDKRKALVLYCNGQYCQASRTLGDQLVAAGFTNVRRYQLGLPIWRALNGLVEIELEGILRIYRIDQTAVFLDARPAADFTKLSLPGTYNMPADGLANRGLRNAPLPNNDFNTRVVLFGHDFAQARALAEAIAKTPFQNVSYFPGTFEALVAALQDSIASRR